MRHSKLFLLVLVAGCLTACIAETESPDAPMQMKPEAPEPEATPQPEAPEPEAIPEPEAPEPEATPEPDAAPNGAWLESCHGVAQDLAAEALVLTGVSETVQRVGDTDAPIIRDGQWDGWALAAFTARFDGQHYFQAWESELVVLQSDCDARDGVDPGNGLEELRLDLAVGETVYLLTHRMSRSPQGIRVEQPTLRPRAHTERRAPGIHFARVYAHPGGRSDVVKVDVQWDGVGGRLTIWDGDEAVFNGGRFGSAGDVSWWAADLSIVGPAAERYRFELRMEGRPVEEVEATVEPVAWVEAGEECDPQEVSSLCTDGLSCVGRFCVQGE